MSAEENCRVPSEEDERKARQLVQGMWLDPETHLTVHEAYITVSRIEDSLALQIDVDAPEQPGRPYLFHRYEVRFAKEKGGLFHGADVVVTPVPLVQVKDA